MAAAEIKARLIGNVAIAGGICYLAIITSKGYM